MLFRLHILLKMNMFLSEIIQQFGPVYHSEAFALLHSRGSALQSNHRYVKMSSDSRLTQCVRSR
jgi:hypothetical protein